MKKTDAPYKMAAARLERLEKENAEMRQMIERLIDKCRSASLVNEASDLLERLNEREAASADYYDMMRSWKP
jgi:hypothetical protein